jgi:integrase
LRRQGFEPQSASFATHKEATQWARALEAEWDKGLSGVDAEVQTNAQVLLALPLAPHAEEKPKTLLRELIARYVEEVTPRKKGAEPEALVLRKMMDHPKVGSLAVQGLTKASFVPYRNERLQKVSPVTLRRQLGMLSHVLSVAIEEWEAPMATNPLIGFKIPGYRDIRRERRLTSEEEQRIIERANQVRNLVVRDAILFAIATGLRRSEILRARASHLRADGRLLHIPDAKNGSPRTVPLSPAAQAVLTQGRRCHPDAFLFPVSSNALRLSWNRILKAEGITDLHFHDLRHEAISRFFELGLNVPEVALISGHKDPRMLFRYTHPDPLKVALKLTKPNPSVNDV